MLRDYQIEVKRKVYDSFRQGNQSVLAQLPTGGGKTIIFSSIIKDGHDNNKRCLILAHRGELILQAAEKLLKNYGIKSGIIKNGYQSELWRNVQVASVPTLVNRTIHKAFDIVIIDEAHHFSKGSSYEKIKNHVLELNPNTKFLGVTATPCRTNGSGFKGIFEDLIIGPTINDLIGNGYLTIPKYYVAPIDLSNVKITAGDYNQKELSHEYQKKVHPLDLVNNWYKLANGLKTIGFACDVDHSKRIIEAFKNQGIAAAHIDGKTEDDVRKSLIKKFEKGEITVLYNVGVFDEGFDCPSIEAVQLARPTKSLIKYMQMVGRALRPAPGKERAIVLDHGGLIAEHDRVEIERNWTLEGVEKKISNKETMFLDKNTGEYYKPQELPFDVEMSNVELVELIIAPKLSNLRTKIADEFFGLQRFAQMKNFNKHWVWYQMARKVKARREDKIKEQLSAIASYFCEYYGYKPGYAIHLVEDYLKKTSKAS